MLIVNQNHLTAKDSSKFYGPRQSWDPLVVVHITDVRGGFGVTKAAIRRWASILAQDLERDDPRMPRLSGPTTFALEQDLSRRLARWERYKSLPYHWIASSDGDMVRNHDASLKTKHGNGGNRGIGWAIDVGRGQELTPALIEAGMVALRGAIVDACDGQHDRVVIILPHRAFSGHRFADPGAIVWSQIVLPVLAETHPNHARADYQYAEKGGRPIPRSWDPSALFDDRGRPLPIEVS